MSEKNNQKNPPKTNNSGDQAKNNVSPDKKGNEESSAADTAALEKENADLKAELAKIADERKANEEKAKKEAESKSIAVDKTVLDQILEMQKSHEEENKSLREELRKIRLEKAKPAEQDKSSVDIDTINDYMDVPVVFFAYTSTHSIHSYQVKKKNLIPPFGKIRFKPTIRYTSGTGMQAKVHAICEYKSQSKREVDFLESSPDFGVKFFKTMTEEKNYNHAYADLLSKESQRVASLTDHMVIAAVNAEKRLVVKQDIKQMRTELIRLRADDALLSQKAREDESLKKMIKDREDLQKIGN
jgi:hypothetical protein